MNEIYEVKVQAASLSIFNPTKLQIGESMPPKTVSHLSREALHVRSRLVLLLLDRPPTKLRVHRSISAQGLRSKLLRLRDYRDYRCELFRFDGYRSCCRLVAVSI